MPLNGKEQNSKKNHSDHRTTNEPQQKIKEESKAGKAVLGRLVLTVCVEKEGKAMEEGTVNARGSGDKAGSFQVQL